MLFSQNIELFLYTNDKNIKICEHGQLFGNSDIIK